MTAIYSVKSNPTPIRLSKIEPQPADQASASPHAERPDPFYSETNVARLVAAAKRMDKAINTIRNQTENH